MQTPKPVLLDLFCGAGGAARGYQNAGFKVIGVDLVDQPDYCGDEFIQGDALQRAQEIFWEYRIVASHASPPCQAFTNAQKIRGNAHPDLIQPTRALLAKLGVPSVMENVQGSPLIDPIELCGCMFPELNVYRSRLFELSGFSMEQPAHLEHKEPLAKMGRRPKPGQRMHVVGNYSGAEEGRKAMGIDWTKNRRQIAESIPPAYTEYLGKYLMAEVTRPGN